MTQKSAFAKNAQVCVAVNYYYYYYMIYIAPISRIKFMVAIYRVRS